MDSESEEIREVYAYFGLALYTAQCLEHGIVNALLYLDLIPSQKSVPGEESWAVAVDNFTSQKFEQTLGKIIYDLKKVTDVPPELNNRLFEALKQRNWLAHRYFRERAEDFLSSEGRTKMIKELDDLVNIFKVTDDLLSLTLEPVLKKYNITQESIMKLSEEMRLRAESKIYN